MRRFALLFAAFALAAALAGCGGDPRPGDSVRREEYSGPLAQLAAPQAGDPIAVFTTSAGEIRAVLYPDEAPMAVENFTGLARQGYYDGLPFHRAVFGFVVQSGDGTGTGLGGSSIWNGNPFPAEYSPLLRHYAGALCAACSPEESPSTLSQFYFVQALPGSVSGETLDALAAAGEGQEVLDAYEAVGGLPYLDNTDTVFGQVYEGMEVVDAIAGGETDENGAPVEPVVIESVVIGRYGEELPAASAPDGASGE